MVNGVPDDLTDALIIMQLRKMPNAPLIKEWKSPAGLLVTLPNKIIFPEQKITIPPGTFHYDLKIIYPNLLPRIPIGGKWTITDVITK